MLSAGAEDEDQSSQLMLEEVLVSLTGSAEEDQSFQLAVAEPAKPRARTEEVYFIFAVGMEVY